VKQSQWKKNIESIEAELLKRGQEKNAPEILKQFSRRLSSIIKQLFPKTGSFSPENSLTVEQLAFTHSLQLYDIKSVMRLAANYDANKGLKVVLPGIEKSYRSLMVIPQLKSFAKNSKELSALDAYKSQLEKSLSEVLDCYIEDLYEEDILAEKMIVVSAVTESVKKRFLRERLSTLVSSNYRVYRRLKNRDTFHRLNLS
jgi:predicted house-cleaning noncanonical NTP pyrophosphatase (MazG superfamily)